MGAAEAAPETLLSTVAMNELLLDPGKFNVDVAA
jgi:hypothetical protein